MNRLVVVYDVTGLLDEEVNALELEATVQAESSDPGATTDAGHPDVPVRSYRDNDSRVSVSFDPADLEVAVSHLGASVGLWGLTEADPLFRVHRALDNALLAQEENNTCPA